MLFTKGEIILPDYTELTREELYGFLKKRPKNYSKADCGDLCIFAGFSGMTGAAYLSSYAALRSGAGLLRLATDEASFNVIRVLLPEAILLTAKDALESLDRFDAVAFGPGSGLGKGQESLLLKILETFKGKILIDADGLTLISRSEALKKAVRKYENDIVITPHEGEAKRLLLQSNKEALISSAKIEYLADGNRVDEYDYRVERKKRCRFLAEEYNTICLLKGHESLVASPEGIIYKNNTGNPGMATAGSGDVLTGIITALMGQGIPAFEAASLGSLIHGYAGDLACLDLGEMSLMASDLIKYLPKAFMRMSEEAVRGKK